MSTSTPSDAPPSSTSMTSMNNSIESCRILYATRSGRAKACARRTARILSQQQTNLTLSNGAGTTFDDGISNLHDFIDSLRASKTCLILFVSTTGDGEQTDSIQRTWKLLLQKSLARNLFEGISIALFSLGDRAYGPLFCAAGRKLAVRLVQLGATLLCEPGYGDDGTPNGGVFADLDVWLQTHLLLTLLQYGNGQPQRVVDESSLLTLPDESNVTLTVSDTPPTNGAKEEDFKEEWQQERFVDSYRAFFQHLRPRSAYRYDPQTLQRVQSHSSLNEVDSSSFLVAQVRTNTRLTDLDWEQDTRHIRLEIQGAVRPESSWNLASLCYRAGDVAIVLPSNSDADVQRFLDVLPPSLKEKADCELQIDCSLVSTSTSLFGSGCSFWPRRCTLRGWLTHCADIAALPEREDLRLLSLYCSLDHEYGKDQRDKLLSLSETSDAALYADYVLREKRSWIDVLYDFDSLRAPGSRLDVTALLTLLGPIRPREFSIASSPSHEWALRSQQEQRQVGGSSKELSSSFVVELCVAVVQGTTPLGRSYHGLCSHYLAHRSTVDNGEQQRGSLVRLWIRPGTFGGLPLQLSSKNHTEASRMEVPVLCIGAGTGIAPLRSLILEREAVAKLLSLENGGQQVSTVATDKEGTELDRDNILIFGCRKESVDFYYKNEWKTLQDRGRLGVLTAFSRDQWHKIYVQQVLRNADEASSFLVRHILDKSGAIYIAGGPKMARAVKDEIVAALAKALDGGEKQAVQLLGKLQRQGRYGVEAWS